MALCYSCVIPPGSGSTWRFAPCRPTWFRVDMALSTPVSPGGALLILNSPGSGHVDMALCLLLCRSTWFRVDMALCLLLCRSTWFRVDPGALLTPVSFHLVQVERHGALLTPVSIPPGSGSTWRFELGTGSRGVSLAPVSFHLVQGRHGALLTPVSIPPGSGSTWRFACELPSKLVQSTWRFAYSCVIPPGSGSTWRFAYSCVDSTWFRVDMAL